MSEYYKVIHFLNYDNLDKVYPCQDYFYDIGEDENVPRSDAPYLYLTNRSTFSRVEYIDVFLKCSQSFSTSDLTFNLSILKTGDVPIMSLSADETVTVDADTLVCVRFSLQPSNTMSEAAQKITGIKSVLLDTPNTDFTIYDIVFCNDNAGYTLEELDDFIDNGENYIHSRTSMISEKIPEELLEYVYTAAAGYAWSATWEFEARVMNDEQKNAKSYGKWLFSIVDDAISDYFDKIKFDGDVDYIQEQLISSTKLVW